MAERVTREEFERALGRVWNAGFDAGFAEGATQGNIDSERARRLDERMKVAEALATELFLRALEAK